MASRNGLNPKIRGPKGVGFGRALPAPFGFGNGIYSTTGTLSIPSFMNGVFVQQPPFTIEFWSKCNAGHSSSLFWYWIAMERSAPPAIVNGLDINGGLGIHSSDNSYQGGSDLDFDGTYQQLVWSFDDSGTCNTYYNGKFVDLRYGQFNPYFPDTFHINFNSQAGGMDEFRYYSKALRTDQVLLNYNNGNGANPCETEFLSCWLQFEKLEMLDFSIFQDGSDNKVGFRDISGKNNHGLPNSLDIDPSSPTYILKPF